MKKSVRYALLAIATTIAIGALGCGVGGDANYSQEVDAFLRQFNGGSSTGDSGTTIRVGEFELTVDIVPPGVAAVEPSFYNGRQMVTVTPIDAFTFINWTGDGTLSPTHTTTEVLMDRNRTITANFRQIGIYMESIFVDKRDGQSYRTVRIGNLTWTAKNLNYEMDSSWCYDCDRYGRLYAWNAAKSACQDMGSGWRLPDTADWKDLVEAAGGDKVAGTRLGATSMDGTDDFGFSALSDGGHYYDYYYDRVSNAGYAGQFWWSATESDNGNAYMLEMFGYYDDYDEEYSGDVDAYEHGKQAGYSVRCAQ